MSSSSSVASTSASAPPSTSNSPTTSAQSTLAPIVQKKSGGWLSRSTSNAKASISALRHRDQPVNPAVQAVGSVGGVATSRLSRVLSKETTSKGKDKEHHTPSALKPVIVGAVKDDWPLYSHKSEDYTIGRPIGFGSSSIVYLATYCPAASKQLPAAKQPTPIQCAIKVIDVDKLSSAGDIERLRRETQLMALSKHPNVLRVRGEWVDDKGRLHIACRFMAAGSIADIAKWAWPDGFPEEVIATVLKQALQGLVYLHTNGWLHRDVKAANLLCDDDGTVLLCDFGVSSSLFQDGALRAPPPSDNPDAGRKSFVGTPCYMAPEIVQRKAYNAKADIWSFGITAIELAAGRAPNSLYAPAKVLSKTLMDAAPRLDREGGRYKYSRALAELVDHCLQKDPAKRPSAERLLHHAFFKQAKPNKFLAGAILADLPPLAERQDRRRNPSVGGTDTVASWDFSSGGTLPASMRSLALGPASPSFAASGAGAGAGAGGDPFANFSSANSAPGSPTSPSLPVGRRMSSLGREREASAGSRRHQRGVSFDLKESPLEEPEGGAGETRTSGTGGMIEEEGVGREEK